MDTLLRIRKVVEVTGMPMSSIYAAIKHGKFPKPVKIGARAVAWRSADIEAWIKSKTEANT